MKYTLKLMFVALLAIFATSCSDPDRAIYDGDATTNQTLVRIAKQSYDIEVDANGIGSVIVDVQASTHAAQDRTYTIVEVSNDIENNKVTYQFDHEVTIPANDYIGSFEVKVTQSNLTDKNYTLKLAIDSSAASDQVILENSETTINFIPFNN